MATARTDQASLIARYAGTFHDAIGGGHHVASPLGAWLLLALCAPAARGAQADALAEVLGGGADDVAAVAAEMLAAPHPLVAAAAAVWGEPGATAGRWLAGLPPAVTRGRVPGPGELDRWARDHTFGLIDRFPLAVDPTVYLLLATALATKVSWERPFDLTAGTALGKSSLWAKDLRHVLRSPNHPAHSAFIAATPQAGDVAVHVGRARGGLLVVSVIAAADVARADVLVAAHAIAIACARGESLARRPLSGLSEGEAPLWSVRDERSADQVGERCVAVLPAWSATDSYDLSERGLGFEAAARALGGGDPWKATQATTASYTRTGFEAASVTAAAVLLAMMPHRGVLRTVELRFGHPYAVVAVTAGDDAGPWHGVPVFSAWVAEPRTAKDGQAG